MKIKFKNSNIASKNKIDLYIIGAGQLGQLIYKEIKKISKYNILGFIDTKSKKKKYEGITIYKNEKLFVKKKKLNLILAVGNIKERDKVIKKFNKNKFKFPIIILNNSYIENTNNIGKFCLIGTDVNILHDVKIGKNCVLGGSTCVGANTNIERNVLIGVGSIFSSNKKIIGQNSIICSGSVVHKDIVKNSKVMGNPFKYILK